MTDDVATVRLAAGLTHLFGDDAKDGTFEIDLGGEDFNSLGVDAIGLLLFLCGGSLFRCHPASFPRLP